MRQKKLNNSGKALRMGFVFLGLVTILIIGSFVLKIIGIARVSLFDGQHRFTVLFQDDLDKKTNTLVSFAPDKKSISILQVKGVDNANPHKLSVVLGIPIDGFVSYSFFQNENEKSTEKYIQSLLTRGILEKEITQTNLTRFDFARLFLFARSVSVYDLTNKEYQITSETDALSDTNVDKMVTSLFADNGIIEEKLSIHVVNASGVTGLGNRFARMLTNLGGNVVAVSTNNSILPRSEVSFVEKDTYTLLRITKILGCKALPLQKQAIGDIVVTLGKDKAALFTL